VSRFRASRKVVSRTGREWEIYVTNGAWPAWKPLEYTPMSDGALTTPTLLFSLVLEIPLFLLYQVLVPALRLLVEAPFHARRLARSPERFVEAIDFGPPREGLLWRTTPDHVARVVAAVAAGLERAEIAHPLGADFLGSTR
jgi:hypothetical protein